jgi:hypothetical protein
MYKLYIVYLDKHFNTLSLRIGTAIHIFFTMYYVENNRCTYVEIVCCKSRFFA